MLGIGFNNENQFYTFDMFNINTDISFLKIKTALNMSGFDTYEPYISTYIDDNFQYKHEHNDQLVIAGDFMQYEMIQITIQEIFQKYKQRIVNEQNEKDDDNNNKNQSVLQN